MQTWAKNGRILRFIFTFLITCNLYFSGEIVSVHVNTSHPEQDEKLSESLKLTDVNSNQSCELLKLEQMGIHKVASRPDQSIMVFFYVNNSEAVLSLLKIIKNGELKKIMEDVLNNIATDIALTVVSIRLDPDEENLCYEFVKERIISGDVNQGDRPILLQRAYFCFHCFNSYYDITKV